MELAADRLSQFLRDEQLLLEYGTDYQDIRHERTTAEVNQFFDPAPYQERTFDMRQEFDYAGVEGRLLSSSYAPGPEHPKHAAMLRELKRFSRFMPLPGGMRSTIRRGCISGGWANLFPF